MSFDNDIFLFFSLQFHLMFFKTIILGRKFLTKCLLLFFFYYKENLYFVPFLYTHSAQISSKFNIFSSVFFEFVFSCLLLGCRWWFSDLNISIDRMNWEKEGNGSWYRYRSRIFIRVRFDQNGVSHVSVNVSLLTECKNKRSNSIMFKILLFDWYLSQWAVSSIFFYLFHLNFLLSIYSDLCFVRTSIFSFNVILGNFNIYEIIH